MRALGLLILSTLFVGCSATEENAGEGEYAPPSSQFGELMGACLEDRGWEVEVTTDGGYGVDGIPDDQRSELQADEEECREETGYDLPSEPISEERAEKIWEEYLEAAECVEEQGFAVEPPPSEETAIEQLVNGTFGTDWNPYEDPFVNADPNSPPVDIYALCPLPASLP